MDYKKQEIKEHFENWIKDQDLDWITQNVDDLHHHAFNTDYYIIGTYKATQWLGDQVFNIIDIITFISMFLIIDFLLFAIYFN